MHVHRTAILTLHHPTRHVKAALDDALASYAAAYSSALHIFRHLSPEELLRLATPPRGDSAGSGTSARRLASSLVGVGGTGLAQALRPVCGHVRESLRRHVARTLLGYAALAARSVDPSDARSERGDVDLASACRRAASYPRRPRPGDVERRRLDALARLAMLADAIDEEQRCAAALRVAPPSTMPLPFCRIDAERTCGLFYNPDTRRYYARLYVCAPASRHARPISAAGRYIDLRSGAVYLRDEDARHWSGIRSFGHGRTSLLVPLELGRWHEHPIRFCDVAILPQRGGGGTPAATPVSAVLVPAAGAYRLHVTFRVPTPPQARPRSLFGVDRGLTALAAGAVSSPDGRGVTEVFRWSGAPLARAQGAVEADTRRRQARGAVVRGHARTSRSDAEVAGCANAIVALAARHQSQVVMEDLGDFAAGVHVRTNARGGRRGHALPERLLSRRQYQKLLRAVDARLPLVGLPRVREVGAAYTSTTCSRCGHVSGENRDRGDLTRFTCVACGHAADADVQAGLTIARKALWLDLRARQAYDGLAVASRTPWHAFARQLAEESVGDGSATVGPGGVEHRA